MSSPGQTHPIKDWEQFAPFAEQSALKREIVAEAKEVQRVVQAEKKGAFARSRPLAMLALVGALVAVVAIWSVTVRGSRKDDVEVADDPERARHRAGRRRGRRSAPERARTAAAAVGAAASPSGMSYEEPRWPPTTSRINMGQSGAGPDLTDTQLSPGRCGTLRSSAPAARPQQHVKVTVRVAIRMGRAVGVSVYTTPPNAQIASCIDRSVRGLQWPVNGKMDSFTTAY